MRYDKRLGIALFTILIIVAISSSLLITPLTVSDSDASTYVIIPILMLPLFAIFISKNRMKPDVKKMDLLLGILAFLFLVLLTVILRFELSFLFLSYRIDMLLFPLLITSFALLLFGSKNLRKFLAIMIYSLLASSLLFAPVIATNQGFTVFNTILVYSGAKAFVHNLVYIPPITISANGHQVGIGDTCVGVGVLIGIILFLLPVAYIYEGSNARKALWVFSGFILLFVLNILRMFGIATAWLVYGPSNALLFVHYFAGIYLFYLSIIVMMVVAGRFGLSMAPYRPSRRNADTTGTGHYKIGIVIAFLIAFSYFAFTLNYYNSIAISPVYLDSSLKLNFNNINMGQVSLSVVNDSGYMGAFKIGSNSSATVLLWGRNISQQDPLVVLITYPNASINSRLLNGNRVIGTLHFIDKRGLSGNIYDILSNNTQFMVYNTGIPYVLPDQYASTDFNIYVVLPANESSAVACEGGYNVFYTDLLNLGNPTTLNQTLSRKMMETFCGVDKLIG